MMNAFTYFTRCVVILTACIFVQSASAQNWYVNDGSLTGDVFTSAVGNDANPGTAALPFLSIDTAIARANPGDIIFVDAGNYVDDSVYITKSLTLRGAKYGVPAGPAAVPLNRGINETIITGGIFIGPSIDDVTIDGFYVDIVAPRLWGIIGRGLNTRIINNMTRATLNIFEIQIGIATRANGPLRLHSYEIKNNNVQGSRYGIFFDGNLESPSQIWNNYVSGAFQAAMVLTGSDGHHYLGNVLENNVQGFQIEKGNILLERNTIRNSITNGARLAATAVTAGNTFINNFFENNGVAINLTEDHPGSVGNSANYNSFTGNVMDIISSHSAQFNATCNWYETTDPTVIATGITGNVLYTPFLVDGTDTDPVLSGFQPTGTCIVVPVTLSNFTGHWEGKNVELNWTTQLESNNRGFEIQRSRDGRNYTNIGFVNGAGNSQQVRNYRFTDAEAGNLAGYLHYRLRQVDFDGLYRFSEVVLLKNENSGIFTIYPNPSSDVLHIKLIDPNTAVSRYQLYNYLGQKVRTGLLNGQLNSVSVKGMPTGTYLLTLHDEMGEVVARNVVLIQ